MKRTAIILSIASVIIAGCSKEVKYDSPLTLSADRNELSASEGSTPVIVYANGTWTASLSEECTWARIDTTEGDGLGQITFTYDANPSIPRKVVIVVKSGAETKTIDMIQKSASDAEFSFTRQTWNVARISGTAHLPFGTSFPESELENIQVNATTSDEGNWLGAISVSADEITFDLSRNNSGVTRTAVITASFTDAFGKVQEAKSTISQSMEEAVLKMGNNLTLSAEEASVELPLETNLGLFIPQLLQSAESNALWCRINPYDDSSQELSLSVEANTTQASRQGRITLSYTDNEGITDRFYLIILQQKQ